jgi:hypothetical protein
VVDAGEQFVNHGLVEEPGLVKEVGVKSVNLVLAKCPDFVKDAAAQFAKDPMETHFKGVKTNSNPDKQNYMLKLLDGPATGWQDAVFQNVKTVKVTDEGSKQKTWMYWTEVQQKESVEVLNLMLKRAPMR